MATTVDYKKVLLQDLHKTFIKSLDSVENNYLLFSQNQKKDSFEFWSWEHMRVSAYYWGLAAMDVMNGLQEMDKEKIVAFVLSAQTKEGIPPFSHH